MLNEELLRESWREIKKHAAAGVDQISAQDYEPQLEENIRDLGERLKQKRYRAKLVCRHYLPFGEVVATDEKGHCNGLSWNAEASRTEEPGAGKSHAGICAGAAG